MKSLPIKKIIFKSFSLPIKEFDNFINIIIVPYIIILPFQLYIIYYDDFYSKQFHQLKNLQFHYLQNHQYQSWLKFLYQD